MLTHLAAWRARDLALSFDSLKRMRSESKWIRRTGPEKSTVVAFGSWTQDFSTFFTKVVSFFIWSLFNRCTESHQFPKNLVS